MLTGLCALGLGLPAAGHADEVEDGASAPPQPNDLLVFAFGEHAGRTIRARDIEAGRPQVFAYPVDPGTHIVRSGTRLNQIVLVRVDPGRLTERTRARAVDGVVAYSGVCTHTGCDVADWNGEASRFKCPCHESEFDPSDDARVVSGPAPWQLAALPLKVADGLLAIAGKFEGRVGFPQPGLDPFGVGV